MSSLKKEHKKLSLINSFSKNENVASLKKEYYDMLLIRRFEEKASQLYGMGFIGGFCHLYIGQEAIVVGIQSQMESQDTVITSYRDHGHMLACGMDPNRVMSELTGRQSGFSKGKGGSMHMFSREKGFYGGHGIVGAQVSLGTGIAFSHKYNEDKGVCCVYMGDGAANQGQVYESFNMASLWKLPAIYIIENNMYSMGTACSRACAGEGLYKRGEPFGIPSYQVDGMDIFAVKEVAKEALARARRGDGPTVIEMMTYRYRGHSMSDPAKYRTREEVEDIRNTRDPITSFQKILEDKYKVSEEEFKEMEKKIKEIVQEAADFSQKDELPDESELWTDVLVD